MKILLISGNNYVLIDDEDYQKVCHLKWSASKSTKGNYSIINGGIKLDRFVMNVINDNLRIKHKDGDPFNVQKHNLIVCTKAQFASGQKVRNGKFKGVSIDKRTGRFRAELRQGKILYYLGMVSTKIEAAERYDLAANWIFGEFASLNFPKPFIKERDTLDLKELYKRQVNLGFEDEVWKPCIGWEKYYNISNYGRMFNIRKNKICPTYPDKDGYVIIHLQTENHNDKYNMKVHRAVAQAFIPNPENKPQVNHKDGNKQNNHIDNLEFCTGKENMQHAVLIGLSPTGEKCYNSKLKEKDVLEIRNLGEKMTNAQISKIYNIHPSNVGDIIKRRTWKHI